MSVNPPAGLVEEVVFENAVLLTSQGKAVSFAGGGAAVIAYGIGWLLAQQLLNFLNEKREVGPGEGKIGRRDAVVFYIGRHMLMMRVRAG